jgi:hypothetical protein
MASPALWWTALQEAYRPQPGTVGSAEGEREAAEGCPAALAEWHEWADRLHYEPEVAPAGPRGSAEHHRIFDILTWGLYPVGESSGRGRELGRDFLTLPRINPWGSRPTHESTTSTLAAEGGAPAYLPPTRGRRKRFAPTLTPNRFYADRKFGSATRYRLPVIVRAVPEYGSSGTFSLSCCRSVPGDARDFLPTRGEFKAASGATLSSHG